ncbi:MAG: hypothetical protein WA130_07270 [Candidatus Methanoperedens sp.]
MQIHTTLTGKLETAFKQAIDNGLFGSQAELIRTAIRNELLKTNPEIFQEN